MQFSRAKRYFSEGQKKGWNSNSDRGTRTRLRVYPVQADFRLMYLSLPWCPVQGSALDPLVLTVQAAEWREREEELWMTS